MLAPDDVLATTLATEFAPATNLKNRVAGATWRYLLPSIERDRVLCLGRPTEAELVTLARVAFEIVIVERGGDRAIVATDGVAGATLRSIGGSTVAAWLAERPAASIDLVWIAAGRRSRPGPAIDDAVLAALPRLLAPDGAVVRADTAGAAVAGRRELRIDVRPARGELRSAVASGDEGTRALLAGRGLLGSAGTIPGPRPVRALLRPLLGRRSGPPGNLRLDLPAGAAAGTLPHPPAYVTALAEAAGVDVHAFRCGLAAPGTYNTQKVLLFLTPPDGDEPSIVVKMTRDPSVNARLENERDGLRHLESLGLASDGRLPRVLFAGRHAGLAIVGESAVGGVPFAKRAGADPAAGPIVDAIDWLVELGVRSARPAAPADVAAALNDLHARYVTLCRPPTIEADRLAAAIAVVAASTAPIPLVFQHGDPGTWNLLVGNDGRTRFLDWENADEAGPPLWDLFYLLRSHAVGSARRAGRRASRGRRLAAIERYLFDASPMSDLVVEVVARYVARVGLDPVMVEPLYHLCWMHQALKEATRVAPDRVRGAHFNRLLRLGLERHDAPTLRRLFGERS